MVPTLDTTNIKQVRRIRSHVIVAYCLLAEVKDGYHSSQSVALGEGVFSSYQADERRRKWVTGTSVPTARPMLDPSVKWLP
jgi:hypothetical protein